MKQIKVYIQDIACHNCNRRVNRTRAEAEDWSEVIFVDRGGMPIDRKYLCQDCDEVWSRDQVE